MARTSRLFFGIVAVSLLAVGAGCGPDEQNDDGNVLIQNDSGQPDTGMSTADTGDTGSSMDTGSEQMDTASDPDTGSSDQDTGTTEDATSDAGMDTSGDDEDTSTSPSAEEVDPNCLDGQYSEPLPDKNADISSEKANYSSSQLKSFIDSVLDKRYSVGRWIVSQGLQKGDRIDCVDRFVRDDSSASSVLSSMSTVVHECGHIFDQNSGGFGTSAYKITQNLEFSCSGGDTTDRNGETFARSRIKNDDYQDQRPPCNGSRGQDCDTYADIYLDGDPDDGEFDGGDQGFNSLLEETLQYVNSLATAYALQDQLGGGSTSALDGILTFLWYTERYLRMARLQYPNAYDHITETKCWREAILTIWGRAWLMLDAAKSNDQLGISHQELFDLVRTPELLQEIERLREKQGCSN